jgi:FtsH-binding integral membrane protein
MTRADDRLTALFAQDMPPAWDAAFSTAVLEKIVRRRFLEDVALLSVASLVVAAVFWAAWPILQPAVVTISQGLAPIVGVLALALCVGVILSGQASSALGLES